MPVCSVFFKNWSHVWSGRRCKTSHFLYVFLARETLVQLVNFEKCHSPLRAWLSPTGTVSIHCSLVLLAEPCIHNEVGPGEAVRIVHTQRAYIRTTAFLNPKNPFPSTPLFGQLRNKRPICQCIP
jgi:hypothetical protein